MALRTPPSWLQNGSHTAENDRLTTQGLFRSSGVLSSADLSVSQSAVPAMSVSVAAGWASILGTFQTNMGAYQVFNDAASTLTVTTSDPTNPRIDLVVVAIQDAFYTGATNTAVFTVVAGTPAASPAAPAAPTGSIILAQLAIAAASTSVVTANITDKRAVAQTLFNTKTINNQTGTTYTITLADLFAEIPFANASAMALLIPTNALLAWPIGGSFRVPNKGAGLLTVAAVTPGTTTLVSLATLSASPVIPVGGTATFTKTATDEWYVTGDVVKATASGGLNKISSASFSGVSAVNLPTNTFNGTYKNYLVLFNINVTSADAAVTIRARQSGVDASGSTYYAGGYSVPYTGAAHTIQTTGDVAWQTGISTLLDRCALSIKVIAPVSSTSGRLVVEGIVDNMGSLSLSLWNSFNQSFDALSFIKASGTFGGVYEVYGYQD